MDVVMSELQTWHNNFIRALQTLRRPGVAIAPPPRSQADADGLRMLLAVRMALELEDDLPDAGVHVAGGKKMASRLDKEHIAATITAASVDIDKKIAASIPALTEGELFDLGIVRTCDFGQTILIGPASIGTYGAPIVCGVIDTLKQNHPLRSVLPPEAFYRLDVPGQTKAGLFLGRVLPVLVGAPPARPWYLLRTAMQLTDLFRRAQRQADQEREARIGEDQRKEALERQLTEARPERRLAALEKRLHELERH